MKGLYLMIPMAPLIGSIIAGLFGRKIGRTGAHTVTIAGVAVAFVLSLITFFKIAVFDGETFNGVVYTWMISDGISFDVGFLIDKLTALMMVVVTFVSLMVHIYTIGYMADDDGYQRFFSYIALFTFSMLMLVMANNFMQLFFGWEAVGLVSYLLIGFWFKKESAIYANMKAFIVNRVGDFGFLLGIAAVLMYFGSVDYADVFAAAPHMKDMTIQIWGDQQWSVMTVICILLFIGAMGKSAQAPLHVWLPDSMEGPTPISALIHAATMVTAGIFMVARMSPLYELSETALSFVLVIGAITAFSMGLLGVFVRSEERRVGKERRSRWGPIHYTMGASAYAAGIFHLMTHAFFKALLFLGAGSVIIAMHHDQDIRNMGGLKKYMPITYWTSLIGSLALIGFPGTAGFFSKDAIIEAVWESHLAGSTFAWICVLLGVFVTALYSFRMFFLVFHGEERMDEHTKHHLKESPKVVTIPLICLAIPSLVAGMIGVGPLLFGGFFEGAIHVDEAHNVLEHMGEEYTGVFGFLIHGTLGLPFLLAMAGIYTAWHVYMKRPDLADQIKARFRGFYDLLVRKYGFDEFNDRFFAGGSRQLAKVLFEKGDATMIDGIMVNGTAKSVGWIAGKVRNIQTGMLYHYAFAMIVGMLLLVTLFVLMG
ncbi:MAG: NADH-quinone oxidoreductase subunit L [Gammaproteobacteria bacterium]|nr:NADH-quinone oxidoreductase subunit L [Gammaproteobacteria bacterium]